MSFKITKQRVFIVTMAETIAFGALTTGAIIGAIAAGTTLATVALSIGAVVAGILTLFFLSNSVACFLSATKAFNINKNDNNKLGWCEVHFFGPPMFYFLFQGKTDEQNMELIELNKNGLYKAFLEICFLKN